MATVTTGMADVFLPTVWSKEVTKAFENTRVMSKLVSRFDADVKAYGDTVKIPNVSSIAATYKVQGSEVSMAAATETDVTININKWGAKGVRVEDIVLIQSKYPNIQYFAEKLGEAIAELQDDDIMALYTSFSNTVGATTNTTGLAWSYVLGAIRTLDGNNVPGKDRSMVVEAYGFEDLRQMDQFVKYESTGRSGRQEDGSTRGKIFGVDVYMTNNCPVTTSLVTGLVFHKEAIALAEQRAIRVQYDYNKRSLDEAVVADILYGVAARRTDAAVRLQYGQV